MPTTSPDRFPGLEPLESRLLLSATFTVDSLADTVASDGDVTLREAIEAANTDTGRGDAPAGSGADVIEFDSGLKGDAIQLTSGNQLSITDDLTITGFTDQPITVDGDGANRVFFIHDPGVRDEQLTVSMSGLRITGARAPVSPTGGTSFDGGGILNEETLTLSDSIITDNRANSGGGIANQFDGDLTIENSTISNNRAEQDSSLGFAGGVDNIGGTVEIRGSTISNNFSNGIGGGIVNNQDVGAVTIINSTISSNETDGTGGGIKNGVSFSGGAIGGGDLMIQNSTIADNLARNQGDSMLPDQGGGGIFVQANGSGSTVIESTIIAGNTDDAGASDLFVQFGSVDSATNSLIESPTGQNVADGQNGNIVGQSAQLMPLDDYGGRTETHALMPGSPALAAGTNPLNLDHDQRGMFYSRTRQEGSFFPYFDVTDIGAYQAVNVLYTVDNRIATVDGDFSDGQFSLREAIQEANANPGTTRGIDLLPGLPGTGVSSEDTIRFDSAIVDDEGGTLQFPAVIVFADDGPMSITDDVVITGYGADQFSITDVTGDANSRVFEIDDGDAARQVQVTLEDMAIANVAGGPSSGDGGGLWNQEDLLIRRGEVRGFVGDAGGAIYNGASGHLTVDRSLMRDNEGNLGGAVFNDGQFDLINSTLSNNTAADDGGAIFNSNLNSDPLAVANSTITQNDAADEGGGIFNATGADAAVDSTIVADNTAGGLLVDSGPNLDGIFAGDFTMVGSAPNGSFPVFNHYTLNGTNNLLATDPDLQPLADNGGATQTHALVAGSPAIDAGSNPENLDVDQRGEGFPRVKGPQADMGAFETGPDVIARQVFYNNSTLDGGDPAANADDDNAIDGDKQPLLPGDSTVPANITAYSKGLNGIVVDIDGVAGTASADDFELKVGNSSDPSTWSAAPAPATVDVRSGEGVDGSDRVTLTFSDGAITGQWLEVTALSYEESGGDLGLADSDRFYFGNLPADFDGNGEVNVTDLGRLGLHFEQSTTDVDDGDADSNGTVDVTDLGIVGLHFGQSLTDLSAPAASSEVGEVSQASPQIAGATQTDETGTDVDLIREPHAAASERLATHLRTREPLSASDAQRTVHRWTPLTLDGEAEEGVDDVVARLLK